MMKKPYNLEDTFKDEAAAIKAVSKGEATPEQQIAAFKCISEKLSDMYGYHYWPGNDGDRSTAFALGRAFVGQMLVGIHKAPMSVFKQRERSDA
jgi:hypothetical protein